MNVSHLNQSPTLGKDAKVASKVIQQSMRTCKLERFGANEKYEKKSQYLVPLSLVWL